MENQEARRRAHLGIDAQTLQIWPITVTSNEVGDSPMAAELLGQIPSHEEVASFTGDGAYDTQDVYEACHQRQAIPIIPPRKGAKLRKVLAFAPRNEAVKARKRFGRVIWKCWSGYHRRSLVETKMNCFKRLDEKVMARTFERQVTELNIRASILNQFTELGASQTVAVT
ncbi:MAG: IS5 family transposase [Comamonas sp.]